MREELKTLAACAAGTILEMYDFALFGIMAPIMAQLFFPSQDKALAMLATFIIFAAGFLIRPFAGAFWGYLGDRIGRTKTLAATVFLMTVATVGIGFIPTYEQAGVWAVLILLALRLLQGFAVSGELSGAIVLAYEVAPGNKKNTFIGACNAAPFLGMLLAAVMESLVTSLLPEAAVYAWGWRLLFILSIFLGFIGFYLRRKIHDSPVFKQLLQTKQTLENPTLILFKQHSKNILIGMCLLWFSTLSIYVNFVFIPSHLALTNVLLTSVMLNISCLFAAILGHLLAGHWLDNYLSLRSAYRVLLLMLIIVPLTLGFMQQNNYIALFITQLFYCFGLGFYIVASVTQIIASFPPVVRYSGVAIIAGTVTALFGGTAPMIMSYLLDVKQSLVLATTYVVFTILLVLTAIKAKLIVKN